MGTRRPAQVATRLTAPGVSMIESLGQCRMDSDPTAWLERGRESAQVFEGGA